MKNLLSLILLFTLHLQAKTYNDVQFEGLVHLSTLSANELVNIKLGSDTSPKEINDALLRLFSQGYFQDIKVIEMGDKLTFVCIEKPVVSQIKFKGVSENEIEEKYKPLIGIKQGEVYNPIKVKQAKNRILEMLEAGSLFDTVVETIIEKEGNEKIDITFAVSKGKEIIITKLDLAGSHAFSKKELQSDVANKEEQSFGWFFGRNDGKLRLGDLEYDNERIKNYYLKHGYLDANVTKARLSVDFKQYSANLHYAIQEGEAYSISGLEIEQLDNNLSLDHLHEEFRLKKDKVFNVDLMRRDVSKIEDAVGSLGYAFAKVYPDVVQDRENHTAKIAFKVNLGQKVYINDVIISGNDRTLDKVIRREIFLSPGDLFNSVELRESKNALGRLGYFEVTNIATKRISANKIDLLISVKETHTASLSVGGGYGSLNGITFNASVTDRNVFGSGKNLSLQLERSEFSETVAIELFNPRVNDSTYSLGSSIRHNKTDYTSFSAFGYAAESNSVSLRGGKQINRYLTTSLSLTYADNFVDYPGTSISTNDSSLSTEQKLANLFYAPRRTTAISLSHYIGFNNTDDFFTPRRGYQMSSSLSVVGFGGDEQYSKENLRFAAYYGLRDNYDIDLVFRLKLKAGYIFGDVNDPVKIPLNSRFRVGGIGSVRGFQSFSVSPIAIDKSTGLPFGGNSFSYTNSYLLGGNWMSTANLELNFPIIEDAKLRGTLFYDHGVIGLNGFKMSGVKAETPLEKKSYGLAFEWQTPMAPLQFVFATPINPASYDQEQSFEFTIGQQF
jgi:outer membrane protein insertion porin family